MSKQNLWTKIKSGFKAFGNGFVSVLKPFWKWIAGILSAVIGILIFSHIKNASNARTEKLREEIKKNDEAINEAKEQVSQSDAEVKKAEKVYASSSEELECAINNTEQQERFEELTKSGIIVR